MFIIFVVFGMQKHRARLQLILTFQIINNKVHSLTEFNSIISANQFNWLFTLLTSAKNRFIYLHNYLTIFGRY